MTKLAFEAQITNELTKSNNPFTIRYVDQAKSTVPEKNFLAIEYLVGDHLETKVGNQPLPEAEIIKISSKLFQALDGLHKKDTIHRDVKPKNIMMKNDGTPILIDFGGAKMLDTGIAKDVGNVTGLGHPGWTCAHQADVNARLNPQCDLYAMGRTIFYMATGTEPKLTDNQMRSSKLNPKIQVCYFSLKQRTLLRQRCSQAFTDLVEKLLDPDHEHYHTATQVIQDLNQINTAQKPLQHLGGGSTPKPTKNNFVRFHQQPQMPFIVLEGKKINLDKNMGDGGLLIGKIHDKYECEIENKGTYNLHCNSPHEGKNEFLGTACSCNPDLNQHCIGNAKHFVQKHHIRIAYDLPSKTWMFTNHVPDMAQSAKKSPKTDWQKLKSNVRYTLNHNDEIALIYVEHPDPIPITFSFYNP